MKNRKKKLFAQLTSEQTCIVIIVVIFAFISLTTIILKDNVDLDFTVDNIHFSLTASNTNHLENDPFLCDERDQPRVVDEESDEE